MKNILFLVAFLCGVSSFAQQERELTLNKENNLIEVVYYHDNGVVSQTGFYTLDGKLQGNWLSYNTEGKKTASAVYDNGEKVGKWFFWSVDTLKEVDYENNAIVMVNDWTSNGSVAIKQ